MLAGAVCRVRRWRGLCRRRRVRRGRVLPQPSDASPPARRTLATTRTRTSTIARSASARVDYLTRCRFPLALGHGLVLVLEESRRATAVAAPALRTAPSRVAHIPEDHALEQPRTGFTALERPPARTPCGIGDPGRRHPVRACGAVHRRSSSARSASRPCGCARSSAVGAADRFPLYPLTPGRMYVNFGFWDVKRTRDACPPGHFNRKIEREVTRLAGIKSAVLGQLLFARGVRRRRTAAMRIARSRPGTTPVARFPISMTNACCGTEVVQRDAGFTARGVRVRLPGLERRQFLPRRILCPSAKGSSCPPVRSASCQGRWRSPPH